MLRENGDKVKHFGVSMFHQLHCLEMVRDALGKGTWHGPDGNGKRGGLDRVEHSLEG
jgi:hypothetical protein